MGPAPATARLRHPEKAFGDDRPSPERPPWIRIRVSGGGAMGETRRVLRRHALNTVCEEAACPNIGECWQRKHATFMILGSVCTRACAFCNVATGRPGPLDPTEPERVAAAVRDLGLSHVVITSVDRDDLADGGARQFAETVRTVRRSTPETTIEVLTPDFRGKDGALDRVMASVPDVFNHNLETVPRLYAAVRPGARYFHSLQVLERAKRLSPDVFTKSGLMVGLGETTEEIHQVMDDLRTADVDFLTLGQYLQPSPKHHGIDRFVTPQEFESYRRRAEAKGFSLVAATPMTRSSYHADEDFRRLRNRRRPAATPHTDHTTRREPTSIAQEATMTTQSQFITQTQKQIAEWQAQIAEAKDQLKTAGDKGRADYEAGVDQKEDAIEQATNMVKQAQDANEQAWKDMQAATEKALDQLQKGWLKAMSRYG